MKRDVIYKGGLILLVGAALTAAPSQAQTLRERAAERGLRIGAALVDDPSIRESGEYGRIASTEFSAVSSINLMKWNKIHPNRTGPNQYAWAAADDFVEFAEDNNQQVHGHTLAWCKDTWREDHWLKDVDVDETDTEALLKNHITTVVTHFKTKYPGIVTVWDVVNEAVAQSGDYRSCLWTDLAGMGTDPATGIPNYIEVAFRAARDADPNAVLIYNDIGPLNTTPVMQEKVLYMLQTLVNDGVPIDGIGLQSHVRQLTYSDEEWRSFINFATRVAQIRGPGAPAEGLRVYVTELDAWASQNTPTAFALQADTYGQFLERFMALPNRDDFTIWGFTDKYTWADSEMGRKMYPLIYDVDYNEKPAYEALERVLRTGTARTQHRDPFARIDAEDHDAQRGAQTYETYVSHFHPGDFIKFAKVDFDAGAVSALDINYAVPNSDAGNVIELRLDSPNTGPVIGTHTTTGTGGWTSYRTRSVDVTRPVSGVRTLFLVGAGGGGPVARVNWLRFKGGASQPTLRDDAFVRSGAHSGTSNNTPALTVKASGSADYYRETLLKFDVGGLSDVGGATLRLYANDLPNGAADVVVFSSDNDGWAEETVTYGSRITPIGNALDRTTVSSGGRWYEWDVTDRVSSEVSNGYSTLTFVVRGVPGQNRAVVFSSKEGAQAPQLVVTSGASCGTCRSTSEEASPRSGGAVEVLGVRPNPVQGAGTLGLNLSEPARIAVRVFDVIGREVLSVAPTDLSAGADQSVRLDFSGLPAGLYLYRVESTVGGRTHVQTGRVVRTGR